MLDLLAGRAPGAAAVSGIWNGEVVAAAPTPTKFGVHLCPKAALALSTALFELATNAAKYGALGVEGGRIDLNWTVAGDRFILDWREGGGPPVVVPQRKGFGFRLSQHGLAAELGGRATTEYPVAGLRFRFEASLSALRGSA
ncbi:hypothetical protein [Caulobacter sp. DWR1-3-2b1]|uniref:hypothetical protein n=1 Tax=Caulobacter sp. DWR1-3-2b1 TaxID=2804670 RepID=UPI003CF49F8D